MPKRPKPKKPARRGRPISPNTVAKLRLEVSRLRGDVRVLRKKFREECKATKKLKRLLGI